MISRVGIVGLGIMGSAFARNLIAAGFEVRGFDVEPTALSNFQEAGGKPCKSPLDIADNSDVVITSLASISAFHDVVNDDDGLAASGNNNLVVIETSTLPIADKQVAHDSLADKGIVMLDCPISGTGSQAQSRDLSVYVSGDEETGASIKPVLDGFARLNFYVGSFGNGSKMKFIANHLVHVHNVASAEAMVLGMKAGMDPQLIVDVITQGAGNSRIFELRAPMMVADDYSAATMKIDVWQKDILAIKQFAESVSCPVSLFDICTGIYTEALANGQGKLDTASVCRVIEKTAGHNRHD